MDSRHRIKPSAHPPVLLSGIPASMGQALEWLASPTIPMPPRGRDSIVSRSACQARCARKSIGVHGPDLGKNPQGEGPALFHSAGSTYMLMSGLTGWNPNPANLVATTAPRLCGAWWKQQPNPAATEGGNITFDSQSTFVLPLQLGGGQTLFIYMGDRWNFKGPGSVRSRV